MDVYKDLWIELYAVSLYRVYWELTLSLMVYVLLTFDEAYIINIIIGVSWFYPKIVNRQKFTAHEPDIISYTVYMYLCVNMSA